MKVLLVDDELMEQMKISLKQRGHTVEHVRSEPEAYEKIKGPEVNSFEIAILDLSMKPPIDSGLTPKAALETGRRVYDRLRRVCPQLKILFYSNNLDMVELGDLTSHPLTKAIDKNDMDGHELGEFISRW
jgi:CheY-like chemotaxis protein